MSPIYTFLALYNHGRGNDEKALRLYERAIRAGSRAPRAYSGYGLLLLRAGQYDKALATLQTGKRHLKKKGKAKEYPLNEWAQLNSNIALCLWKMGDIDGSVDAFTEVFGRYRNSTLYGSLGFLLILKGDGTGDYARAVAFNEEALDYNDDDPVILDNVGQLSYRLKDYERAAEMFKKALAKKPLQVDSLYYLALTLEALGDNEAALAHISKALDEGKFGELNTISREQAEALRARLTINVNQE